MGSSSKTSWMLCTNGAEHPQFEILLTRMKSHKNNLQGYLKCFKASLSSTRTSIFQLSIVIIFLSLVSAAKNVPKLRSWTDSLLETREYQPKFNGICAGVIANTVFASVTSTVEYWHDIFFSMLWLMPSFFNVVLAF